MNNSIFCDGCEIKLNPFIFLDILPFVLYNCKFQRLLELSLISKSTFRSVQYYVTHKQNEIKFYPSYQELLEYIQRSTEGKSKNISDDSGSDYKGIESQKRNIEINESDIYYNDIDCFSEKRFGNIIVKRKREDIINFSIISRENQDYQNNKSPKIKNDEYFNKNDAIKENVYSSELYNNEIYKFKLFKFNKLSHLYCRSIFINDSQDLRHIKDQLINYCGSGLKKVYFVGYFITSFFNIDDFFQIDKWHSFLDISFFEFEEMEIGISNNVRIFNYFSRFNSKKFKISSNFISLWYLDDILNFKSLESIKFGYYDTVDDKFIVKALLSTSPQLKELTIRPNSGKSIADVFIKSNITNNKSLNKLILRRQINRGSSDYTDPTLALEQLIGNTSILTLGLELYQLMNESDYKLLSPLIQIPNIQELICDFNSVIPFLLHCHENTNIKTLHIKNCQYNEYYDEKRFDDNDTKINQNYLNRYLDLISNSFSKLITQNQSLECIKITACYQLYNKLNETLNQYQSNNNTNNNNNNLQLIKINNNK